MSERRPYKRPEIITDEYGKARISKPLWNHDTMAWHVMQHGGKSWLTVGELARVVWGRNSDALRKAVRRRLPALKRHFALVHHHLLVVEYNDDRGSASAVKVYDPTAPGDIQSMQRMIRTMNERKDAMLSYYQKVSGLSGIEPAASTARDAANETMPKPDTVN